MKAVLRRWLDMRIGQRVLVWLLLAAMITLIVAVVSIYYLQSVGQRLTSIAEHDRAIQTAGLDLETIVERESAGVISYLLSGDPAHLELFASGQVQFSTVAQRLDSLAQSPQDAHMLTRIRDLHAAFRGIADEQVSLRDHGFPQAAVFLWQTQGNDAKRSLDDAIGEFVARQELVITDNSEKASAQRRQAFAISLGLVGFIWIMAVSGGMITTRSIVSPIRRLVSNTEAIAKGDTSARLRMTGKDELALLGNAMDRMAEDLDGSRKRMESLIRDEQHRVNQLRAIADVGRKISSILALEDLLPYVAESVRDTFDYYSVNIFLVGPGPSELTLRASAVKGGVGVSLGKRFKLGTQGIVVWVAENGRSLLALDVANEPRFLFEEELAETKSELAAPIKLGGSILGVLDIQSSDLGRLLEVDVPLVETLADQVAIALQNAQLYEQTRQMAVIEERNRMAREIHDTLAQGFTGIVLQLEAAEQAIDDNPSEAQQHLDRARRLARESLQAARRSVWNLLPKELEERSLESAIEEEVRRFREEGKEKSSFSASGDRRELPPDVQAALLRVCQESLTNVRKHAEATKVVVELRFQPEGTLLRIQDDGRGFNVSKARLRGRRGGMGLPGMIDRAHLLGGVLSIQSAEGEGTIIEVRIPV